LALLNVVGLTCAARLYLPTGTTYCIYHT
jgi:hypothetical protein